MQRCTRTAPCEAVATRTSQPSARTRSASKIAPWDGAGGTAPRSRAFSACCGEQACFGIATERARLEGGGDRGSGFGGAGSADGGCHQRGSTSPQSDPSWMNGRSRHYDRRGHRAPESSQLLTAGTAEIPTPCRGWPGTCWLVCARDMAWVTTVMVTVMVIVPAARRRHEPSDGRWRLRAPQQIHGDAEAESAADADADADVGSRRLGGRPGRPCRAHPRRRPCEAEAPEGCACCRSWCLFVALPRGRLRLEMPRSAGQQQSAVVIASVLSPLAEARRRRCPWCCSRRRS
mmetsp:Transcript_27427/g.76923  ORF Transcript_27427/g.76923 Transcript_27427/m.76923 type:complete len:290 (+) Transcript_27427:510-1379(+)